MIANLYINSSSADTLNKNISQVDSTTLTLYESTDILHPTFKVKHKTNANYMFVVGLGYYYINNQILGNQCCYLVCEKDVLMSNISEILNLECFILRNENEYNLDIPDNLLPLQEKTIVYSRTDTAHAPNIGIGTLILHTL